MSDDDKILTLGAKTATTQAIGYGANTSGSPREASLRFTISNAAGRTAIQHLGIRQEGGDALSVSTDAVDLSQIPASPSGTITATITLEGSATDWSVAKSGTNAADFTLSTTSGDETNNTLAIDYTVNAATSPRTATLTFTATGGDGPDGTQVLALTQLAEIPTITIVEGATLTHPLLPSAGSFDITYTYGGTAISASSTIVGGSGFLTASGSPVSVSGSKEATQAFNFVANNTGISREATIQFTATDGSKSVTEELLITQSGANEPPTISVSTDSDISNLVSAYAGTITATITLGGSATGFQVSKSGDADDSFIGAFSRM